MYLDEEQAARLDERAAAEGVTRSTMIRRAVEQYLSRGERDPEAWRARWRQALQESAGIATYLPDGASYVGRVRAVDAERLTDLER